MAEITRETLNRLKRVEDTIDELPDALQGRVYGAMCIAAARLFAQKYKAAVALFSRTGKTANSIRAEYRSYKYRNAAGGETTVPNAAARVLGSGVLRFLESGTESRDGARRIKPKRIARKLVRQNDEILLQRAIGAGTSRAEAAFRELKRKNRV